MRRWAVMFAGLLALVVAPRIFAQERAGVEVAPFVSYRFGGSVGDTSSAASYGIDGARSEGVTVSIPVRPKMAVELLFSRQDTGVDVEDLFDRKHYALTIDHWMAGAVGEFPGHSGRVRPFVGTYLGLTRIRTSNDYTTSNGYFSAAIGGGVKFDLAQHVGVRFDARGYAVFVSSGAGAICGPAGCSAAFSGDAMFQGEVAASLVLKF